MNFASEIDRNALLSPFERFCLGVLMLFAMACLAACIGCKTYYENAGMRVRAGSVTAPVEVSEPTSSVNVRLLFFLDGVDLYSAKGYSVEMDYSKCSGGTWLTSASTQGVHVVVSPFGTNAVKASKCDGANIIIPIEEVGDDSFSKAIPCSQYAK